jgi:hypothetical protein
LPPNTALPTTDTAMTEERITFLQAMRLMRRPDARLFQTNVRNRWEYWVTPPGVRIERKVAEQIKRYSQVKGDDALFFGLNQTWRIAS